MRQSKLFTKTLRDVSEKEVSLNAKLLTKAGFKAKDFIDSYIGR